MRPFIDKNVGLNMKRLYKKDDQILYYKETNDFWEFELTLNETYLIYYVIPNDDNSFFIATCWPILNDIYNSINEDEVNVKDVYNYLPTYKSLIYNAYRKDFSNHQIVRTVDMDNNRTTWMLIKLINREIVNDFEKFISQNGKDITDIIKVSGDLFSELNTKPKFKFSHLLEALKLGGKLALTTSVIPEIFDKLGSVVHPENGKYLVNAAGEIVNSIVEEHITKENLDLFKLKDIIVTTELKNYYKP